MSKCQNNVQFLVFPDYFRKISNQIWIENIEMTGQKDKKSFQKNFFILNGCGKIAWKEMKGRKQSGNVMQTLLNKTV